MVRLFDSFIPKQIRSVPEHELKARVLLGMSVLAGFACCAGMLLLTVLFEELQNQRIVLIWTNLSFSLLCLSTPWLLRWTASLKIAVMPILLLALCLAILGGFQNGGMHSPIIVVLFLLPLASQFFGNTMLRNIMAILAIGIFASIRLAEVFHFSKPYAITDMDSSSNAHLIIYILLSLTSLGLAIAYEHSRRATEQRLQQLARVASIGMVSGGFAHEMNTPLSVLMFASERLVNLTNTSNVNVEQLKNTVAKIESATGKIAKVVKAIRANALEDQKGSFERHSLQHVLNFALVFCEESLHANQIDLIVEGDPKLIHIECRPTQIAHVFTSLFSNSIEALRNRDPKWIRISTRSESDFVEIRFTDSGKGINADIQAKLFTPFYTTKDIGQGYGLGLANCASIVHLHHGHIYFDKSSPNTSFVIQLPKSQSLNKSASG